MIGAGQAIGNYRILSKIGTGGMGAVYLAEHPLIGKKVALKVIHRELAGNREVVQRFFQEARAVNTIGNEHIVEIHDFGVTPEGDHFYIMEYLQGATLASVITRARVLDVMRALHIAAQIAKALAAAHAAGVIHRDLKPDNIMLTSRLGDPDFVKVLDFGLAKMFAEHGSAVKTAAGVLLGTPQYMSPEACESKRDIDHRTDIYALGVLVFQMMTGVLPFDGESMGEVLVKQVTALPPAPRGFNPAIPPSVEQVLLRCLAKSPDARFPTMLALREALLDPEAYLRGSPPIAPARSVAPGEAGVDAATVLAHAAALQQTKVASLDAIQKAKLAGISIAPPGAGHPGIAPTIIDGAGVPPPRRPLPTGAVAVPDLAPPIEPKNNTMRIATPLGHSSRPPRKMWPIVLGLGLVLGLGAGAFAVAWHGRGGSAGEAPTARGDATGSGQPVASGRAIDAPRAPGGSGQAVESGAASAGGQVDAGAAASAAGQVDATASASAGGQVDAGAPVSADGQPVSPTVGGAREPDGAIGSGGAPAVVLAKLTIESVPSGATVVGPDGKALGKTPLKLEWPVSPELVAFELRLAGYRKKPKPLVVGGNTAMRVELERLPRATTGRGSGGGSSDGLMRPE